MCTGVLVSAYQPVEVTGPFGCYSSYASHQEFWGQDLPLACYSPSRLGWLARKYQPSQGWDYKGLLPDMAFNFFLMFVWWRSTNHSMFLEDRGHLAGDSSRPASHEIHRWNSEPGISVSAIRLGSRYLYWWDPESPNYVRCLFACLSDLKWFLETMLKSSCWQGKHFTDWAIILAWYINNIA